MKYYYTYNCPDIDEEIYTSEHATLDDLLTNVSRSICFNDCVKMYVFEIVADGRKLSFAGWKPNMEFAYKDIITGEIVWTGRFPEWEH